MMISFSSRRLLLFAVILLILVTLMRSRLVQNGEVGSAEAMLRRRMQQWHIQRGVEVEVEIERELKFQLLQMIKANNSSRTTPGILPPEFYYFGSQNASSARKARVASTSYLAPLLTCSLQPNPYTNHVRLRELVLNISFSTSDGSFSDTGARFNPTILAMPPGSANHYLLVARVVTQGRHQESLICEANRCHNPSASGTRKPQDSRACTPDSLQALGWSGGLQCATAPQILRIPPTPALRCTGAWSTFPDIPGFHDPRIFWSGKGEPLIIVNSASAYACVGLWVVDLRTLYVPLEKAVSEVHARGGKGTKQISAPPPPLMSYPTLTELTRNPAWTRASVEKNWFLFFAGDRGEEAFVHYDIVAVSRPAPGLSRAVGGRSFAKLIGNGFTTENLTDPLELPCLSDDGGVDSRGRNGQWHQASNALRLVLCSRAEARSGGCNARQEGRTVNLAVIHRKFSNEFELPLRYERYFMLWDTTAPFHLRAVSKFPVLLWNETASGWSGEENWKVEMEEQVRGWNGTRRGNGKGSGRNQTIFDDFSSNMGSNWAYFTYTPSIAWAWRPADDGLRQEGLDSNNEGYVRSLDTGYFDDKVILGIGMDDTAQAFAMAKAETLLQCMRVCPGGVQVEGARADEVVDEEVVRD